MGNKMYIAIGVAVILCKRKNRVRISWIIINLIKIISNLENSKI